MVIRVLTLVPKIPGGYITRTVDYTFNTYFFQ
jgi:hypothetical protein